jgi:hypothetical protein
VSQLAAPVDLALTTDVTGVTLTWMPLQPISNVGCRIPGVTGPDLRYRLYYGNDSACAPFDGTGLTAGPSPIEVGTAAQIHLSGAPHEGMFYVVTAIDYLGRESHFSNFVGSPSREYDIYMPVMQR